MTKSLRLLLPLVALLGLATRSARAADPPPDAPGGTAQKATDADQNEARRIFRRGQAHYNLNEYAQAADDFDGAYRLYPLPIFLYNVAQAHRLAGNEERALYFYRTYLRTDPRSKLKAEVQDRIATLERSLAAKGSDTTGRTTTPPRPPVATITPPPANPPLTTAPPSTPPSTPTPSSPPVATATSTPASTTATSAPAPESNTLVAAPPAKPLYKKWWLWTLVGGVVVAGVVVGVAVGVTQKGPSGPPAINF